MESKFADRKKRARDECNHLATTWIEICSTGDTDLARRFYEKILSHKDTCAEILSYNNFKWYQVAARQGHMFLMDNFESEIFDLLDAIVTDDAATNAATNADANADADADRTGLKKKGKDSRYFRYLAFDLACEHRHIDVVKHLVEMIEEDVREFTIQDEINTRVSNVLPGGKPVEPDYIENACYLAMDSGIADTIELIPYLMAHTHTR